MQSSTQKPEQTEESIKPSKTLILFTIGPVQEFIAQARRTRDLWFGSHILSELAKTGAKALSVYKSELIYPVFSEETLDIVSAPNKILAIVETDNPRDVARSVRKAITDKWIETAQVAYDKVEPFINIGTWKRQIGDLIEFHAAWTTLDHWEDQRIDGETAYSLALSHVEDLLTARKTLREFKQNDPGRIFGDMKSSLDGGRESVWLDGKPDHPELAKLGIKKFETLDAISVVKRLSLKIYPKQETFHSVCETAFLPYIDYIQSDNRVKKEVIGYLYDVAELLGESPRRKLLEQIATDYYEARLFYVRRIEDFLEEHADSSVSDSDKEELKAKIVKKLMNLYRNYIDEEGKHFRIVEPSPYYAFLVADGDRMGKYLRGIKDKQSHQDFSKGLSAFATSAAKIMKKNKGVLVYGGGDDVMAYLPVHKCLGVVQKLHESFACIMRSHVSESMRGEASIRSPFTLSVGVVIVHMLEPLEEVRQLAHAAEQQAKQTRDTIAIHFHKRGGGDLMRVALPFASQPVKQMQDIHDWMKESLFSSKFAYELRDLYRTYTQFTESGDWLSDPTTLQDLLWLEIERLAVKKKPQDVETDQIRGWVQKLRYTFSLSENPLENLKQMAEQFILVIHLEEVGSVYEEKATDISS